MIFDSALFPTHRWKLGALRMRQDQQPAQQDQGPAQALLRVL